MSLLVYMSPKSKHTVMREWVRPLCNILNGYSRDGEELVLFVENYHIDDCKFAEVLNQGTLILVGSLSHGFSVLPVDEDGSRLKKQVLLASVCPQAQLHYEVIRPVFSVGNILNPSYFKAVAILEVINQDTILDSGFFRRIYNWLYIFDNAHFLEKLEGLLIKNIYPIRRYWTLDSYDTTNLIDNL